MDGKWGMERQGRKPQSGLEIGFPSVHLSTPTHLSGGELQSWRPAQEDKLV